jgi:hypothetical protein
MKQLLDLFIKPIISKIIKEFEFEIDRKALKSFILWVFSRLPIAEIAERADPIFKGKTLFEKVDDIGIFELLTRLKKWAEER